MGHVGETQNGKLINDICVEKYEKKTTPTKFYVSKTKNIVERMVT